MPRSVTNQGQKQVPLQVDDDEDPKLDQVVIQHRNIPSIVPMCPWALSWQVVGPIVPK